MLSDRAWTTPERSVTPPPRNKSQAKGALASPRAASGKDDWTESPLTQKRDPINDPIKIDVFSSPKPGGKENLVPPKTWHCGLLSPVEKTPGTLRLPTVQEQAPSLEEVGYMPVWLSPAPKDSASSGAEDSELLVSPLANPQEQESYMGFSPKLSPKPRVVNTFLHWDTTVLQSPLPGNRLPRTPNTEPKKFAPQAWKDWNDPPRMPLGVKNGQASNSGLPWCFDSPASPPPALSPIHAIEELLVSTRPAEGPVTIPISLSQAIGWDEAPKPQPAIGATTAMDGTTMMDRSDFMSWMGPAPQQVIDMPHCPVASFGPALGAVFSSSSSSQVSTCPWDDVRYMGMSAGASSFAPMPTQMPQSMMTTAQMQPTAPQMLGPAQPQMQMQMQMQTPMSVQTHLPMDMSHQSQFGFTPMHMQMVHQHPHSLMSLQAASPCEIQPLQLYSAFGDVKDTDSSFFCAGVSAAEAARATRSWADQSIEGETPCQGYADMYAPPLPGDRVSICVDHFPEPSAGATVGASHQAAAPAQQTSAAGASGAPAASAGSAAAPPKAAQEASPSSGSGTTGAARRASKEKATPAVAASSAAEPAAEETTAAKRPGRRHRPRHGHR